MLIQPLTPQILEKRRNLRRKILGVPGRIWRKTRRGLLWTLAIGFVAHSALNIYASMLLNRELSAIRQKVEPLQFSELAPPAVPDSQNAALVYKAATQLLHFSKEEKKALITRPGERTPHVDEIIQVALYKNRKALDWTRRAASMPKCRFPLDYGTDNQLTLLFPHYGGLRELTRLLAARAVLKAENGDQAEALRDVRAIFSISRHLSGEPFMVGFIVAQLVDTDGNQALSQVLENGHFTVQEARAFKNSLPKNDWPRAFQRALLGERTFSLFVFGRLQSFRITEEDLSLLAGDSPPGLWTSYPLLLLWRPIIKLDEVQSLRLWQRMLDAAQSYRIPTDLRSMNLDKAIENSPRYAVMTRALFPVFDRAGDHRDFAEVKRRQREIALALAVYRTQKGRYPAQLLEVASLEGKPLPLDPYSQKPFVYHSDGKNFALYSVGVNRSDDGGRGILYGYIGSKGSRPGDDDFLWGRARY